MLHAIAGSLEVYNTMGAPERTTRVANRMIGAALGLRIPSNAGRCAAIGAHSAADVVSKVEPPVIDAWDD